MGVITACNPGERRDRRSSRQTGYWSKLELISSGFNRRPCPTSNHGRNMMSALGLQMLMYTHEFIPHSFTDSWPLLGDNVILHLHRMPRKLTIVTLDNVWSLSLVPDSTLPEVLQVGKMDGFSCNFQWGELGGFLDGLSMPSGLWKHQTFMRTLEFSAMPSKCP